MSEGFDPVPVSNDQALPPVGNERDALVFGAKALREEARKTRAKSREIVARCVEGRISREHRRS